jgi:hypothetical protein
VRSVLTSDSAEIKKVSLSGASPLCLTRVVPGEPDSGLGVLHVAHHSYIVGGKPATPY